MIANWSNLSSDTAQPDWVTESLREHYEPKPDTADYTQQLEVLLGKVAEVLTSDNSSSVKVLRLSLLLKKTGWIE